MSIEPVLEQPRRRRPAPVPNGAVRTFGDDETIVTKTDLKGRITYANDVFLRVSAYDEDEVVGQPHNIIRHPDMPAGVFKLLWQRLEEGQEIFAYVLNLAGDGVAYWVLAHVTPTLDPAGRPVAYHSTRRTVPSAVVSKLGGVYGTVRRAERGIRSARAAATTGLDTLVGIAGADGFDFDRWTWSFAAPTGTPARVTVSAATKVATTAQPVPAPVRAAASRTPGRGAALAGAR